MSKFCGVISEQQNVDTTQIPLRFVYLEILADWLSGETQALRDDFANKCRFMQEHQDKIIENEQFAININAELNTLNSNLLVLEQELQENSSSLEKLEQAVRATELREAALRCHCKCPSEHELMLQTLEQTDKAITSLNSMVEEIVADKSVMQAQISPYNIICSILDCQITVLLKTEQQLDTLLDKSGLIDDGFTQVMEKMAMERFGVPTDC